MPVKTDYLTKRHKSSPFITQILLEHTIPQGKVAQGDANVVLMNINDKDHYVNMTELNEIDSEVFIKTFVNHQAVSLRLSNAGKNMMQYCISRMVPNKDTILISIEDARAYCKYKSTVQVYRGLQELVMTKVIAPSVEAPMWYINPALMFNGRRFSVISSFVAKHKTPQEEANEKQRSDMLDVMEHNHRTKYPEMAEELPFTAAAPKAIPESNGKAYKGTVKFEDEEPDINRDFHDMADYPPSPDGSSTINPSPAYGKLIREHLDNKRKALARHD